MSTVKTRIDSRIVLRFLRKKFDASLHTLTLLKGGELSEAFSVIGKGNRNLIVRVNNNSESFAKDLFAYEHFRSANIPIPEVLFMEAMQNMFMCVTERAEGQTVDCLEHDEQIWFLPKMFDCLDKIQTSDITLSTGFGRWNAQGNGMFRTWKDAMLNILERTIVNADWFTWEELFENTSMEREMYVRIVEKIQTLSQALPEKRSLIHGDFGYGNLVVSGGQITAVIDWGEAAYGDPLYDIAWLDFHAEGIPFAREYAKHRPEENFHERVLCYKLCIGLGCLGFCAKAEKMEEYTTTKEKIIQLLTVPPIL